jgi:peptidoglycan/LPS O-acetylase OafA/YrhL
MPALFATAWYLGWTGWIFDVLFVVVACPLIIAGGMRLCGAPRWAYWAGMLSFPLFAVHMPILQTASEFGLSYLVGGALALAGGVLAAVATNWPKLRAAKNGKVPA